MKQELVKHVRRARRVLRVRKSISGTQGRPRLAVARTLKNISAQIIDDDTGRTLCAASTQSRELRDALGGKAGGAAAAAAVGKALGEKARSLGIELVAFDRRGRRYHGRVKALADAAREAGLKF